MVDPICSHNAEDHETSASSTRSCIHIGLAKTATKMLQKRLFRNHPGIKLFGFAYDCKRQRFLSRNGQVKSGLADLLDKQVKNADRSEMCALMAKAVGRSKAANLVPLWSWERLSLGVPGRRRARAQYLRDVIGPARIIVVLRHPVSLIESVYFQVIERYHIGAVTQSLWMRLKRPPWYPTFEQWVATAKPSQLLPVNHIDYGRTIRFYEECFGRENIHILLFEQLEEDPEGFIRQLCSIIGVDADEGVQLTSGRRDNDRWNLQQIRQLERICGSFAASCRFRLSSYDQRKQLFNSSGGSERDRVNKPAADISPEWKDRIENLSREGNRYLVEHWKLPLDRYGYPV